MDLYCVVVGTGIGTVVQIDNDTCVWKLKRLLKSCMPVLIQCRADKLKLHVAVDGDEWLSASTAAGQAVIRGKVPASVKGMLSNEMHYLERLCDVDFEYQRGNIHILVQLPKQPSHTVVRTLDFEID